MNIAAISQWWAGHKAYFLEHPELFVLVVWPALTAALSFVQGLIAKRWPKAAQALSLSGLDANGLARLLWSLTPWGRDIPPPAAPGAGGGPGGYRDSVASTMASAKRERLESDRRDFSRSWALAGVTVALGLMFAALLAITQTGCTKQEAKTVLQETLSVDQKICVVEHAFDIQDLSPAVAAAVALQCNVAPAALVEVLEILGTTRAGIVRYVDKIEAAEAKAKADAAAKAAEEQKKQDLEDAKKRQGPTL